MSEQSQEFMEDSLRWRGRILNGVYAHWCFEWDELPIDETCPEWPCGCGFQEFKDKTLSCARIGILFSRKDMGKIKWFLGAILILLANIAGKVTQ